MHEGSACSAKCAAHYNTTWCTLQQTLQLTAPTTHSTKSDFAAHSIRGVTSFMAVSSPHGQGIIYHPAHPRVPHTCNSPLSGLTPHTARAHRGAAGCRTRRDCWTFYSSPYTVAQRPRTVLACEPAGRAATLVMVHTTPRATAQTHMCAVAANTHDMQCAHMHQLPDPAECGRSQVTGCRCLHHHSRTPQTYLQPCCMGNPTTPLQRRLKGCDTSLPAPQKRETAANRGGVMQPHMRGTTCLAGSSHASCCKAFKLGRPRLL
jgi:hypothetical protein